MALRSWWTRLAQGRTPSDPSRRRASRPGPRLEALEDRAVPAAQLVSATPGTTPNSANGLSTATNQGSISDLGRYVVYLSDANNLVEGQVDPGVTDDVFLYDKELNTTRLISRQAGAAVPTAGNGTSYIPSISGDGKWVAFTSEATNLVGGVTVSGAQVYLYDVENDALSLVTYKRGSTTEASNGGISTATAMPSLSDDGRYLTFISDATDLFFGQTTSVDSNSIEPYPQDAFLYDRLATGNKFSLVSHVPWDVNRGGNELTSLATISGDGSTVVFKSYATNLGQSEGRFDSSFDIFRYDVATRAVTLVTHAPGDPTTPADTSGDTDFAPPSVSDNGQYIAYLSKAPDLVAGQVDPGTPVTVFGFTFYLPNFDAFLYDAQSGSNTLVTKQYGTAATAAGVNVAESPTNRPVVSGNGSVVAFTSPANNLLAATINAGGNDNTYLYQVAGGAVALVSHTAASATDPASGNAPTVSNDGRYVAFVSTTAAPDVYRFDGTDGSLTLISHVLDAPTTPSGGINATPSISGDGLTVAWNSTASNMVANDANGKQDVFITGTTDSKLSVTATSIDEGQSTTLTVTITDPTPAALYTVTVAWDKNTTQTFNNVTAGKTTYTRQYYDDDPTATAKDNQAIVVTATPAAGAPLSKTATIEIRNVNPVLAGVTVAPTSATENGYVTLTGTFTDVGTKDSHTLVVDWGDGKTDTVTYTVGEPHDFSLQHKYLDDNPTGTSSDQYPVSVTVTDDDTGSATEQVYATVANAVPTLSGVTVTSNTLENGTVTLTGSFADVGTLDTHKLTVAWGDGKTDTLTYAVGDPKTFSITHKYLDDDPTATPSDLYAVDVTVEDDDTGVAATTVYTTVANVAPTLSNVNVTNAAENGTVTLTGTIADVGTLDTHTLVVTWGDGKTSTVNVTPTTRDFTVTHQYLDDDPTATASDKYSVAVTVADDDTATATATVYTTITNAAPTLSNVNVTNAVENGVVTLTGTIADVGTLDTHTLTVTWGDGKTDTVTFNPGDPRGFSLTHTYPDDNPTATASDPYSVSLELADDDTGTATATVNTTITNAAPTLANVTVTDAAENGTVTLTGTIADVGTLDTHTLVVTWGDGKTSTVTFAAGSPRDFTVTHQYLDDDPTATPSDKYAVGLTLTDDDTGVGTATVNTTITNVVPTLSNVTVTDAAENGTVTVTGSFADAGTLDAHTLTVAWGDGKTSTINLPAGARTFSAQHQYLDDDPTATASDKYAVAVTVTDDDGGAGTATVNTTITNAVPTLSGVTVTSNTLENGTVTLTGSFADAGTLDTHKMTVTWGDGKTDTVTFAAGDPRDFTLTHTYLDDDPTATSSDQYAVGVTVADDDGGSGTTAVNTTVANVAPVLTQVTVSYPGAAGLARLTGTFTDPGTADTYQLTLVWGDGQTEVVTLTAGTRSFDVTHQYPLTGGTYAVGLTLRDDDSGSVATTASVVFSTTNNPPVLTVSSAVSVPENTTAVATASATDPDPGQTLTFTLTGPDAARFAVNASGVITFVAAPNYEAPADADGNNVYLVTVNVSDGIATTSQTVTVTVTDVNEPPVLSVASAVTIPENTTAVATASATDPDPGQTLTYSLSGTDAARLVIHPSSGVIAFAKAPDYEAPTDADGNNVYLVTVNVSDGNGGTDSRPLAVTVSDVSDGITIVRVVANGGTTAPDAGVTFSQVNSLSVTFSTPVYGVDPGAFTLTSGATTLTSGPTGPVVVSGLGTSTLTLTFSGTTGVNGTSLADGVWSLTTDLSKVQTGVALTRSRVTTGNIRRLFGDASGDGTVNLTDFGLFGAVFGRSTTTTPQAVMFDYNGDTVINLVDFGAFGQRFGKGV